MTSIEKINILLIEHGMSGSDLCKAIGVSSGVYSQWNKRRNKISAKNLKKIADIFKVSVFTLYDDEEKTATIGDGKSYVDQLKELIPTLTEQQAQDLLPTVLKIVSPQQIQDDLQ